MKLWITAMVMTISDMFGANTFESSTLGSLYSAMLDNFVAKAECTQKVQS